MELVGPSGKSISGNNKHILKLMIDQTFGHWKIPLILKIFLQYFLVFLLNFLLFFFLIKKNKISIKNW